MAIQLEGNIEALRIYEYLTKVLGVSDLANYFLLIDKQGEARAQKVSLASLLTFSDGNLKESTGNTFATALDFTLNSAQQIFYNLGTQSGALTFSIGTAPIRAFIWLYTQWQSDGSALNLPSSFEVLKNEYVNDTAIYNMIVFWDGNNYQAQVWKVKDLDVVAPTITGFTLEGSNIYVDVEFSEGVYGAADGSTPVASSDISITNFVPSGATAVSISSIQKTGGGALTGGETTIRCNLAITGTPDGTETFEIQPMDGSSIYDGSGNAMLSTQTTGTITLNYAASIRTADMVLRISAASLDETDLNYVDSGQTISNISGSQFDVSSAALMYEGMFLRLTTGASGTIYHVQSIAGSTITVDQTVSASPGDNAFFGRADSIIDQSPNGVTIGNTTAAKAPIFIENISTAKKSLYFNGADSNRLNCGPDADLALTASDCTFFLAGTKLSSATNQTLIGNNFATAGFAFFIDNTEISIFVAGSAIDDTIVHTTFTGRGTAGIKWLDVSHSADFFINGTDEGNTVMVNDNSIGSGGTTLIVGVDPRDGSGLVLTALVEELILYNVEITDQQIIDLDTILGA